MPPSAPPHVAYIMSRFPKLTETFILYEILALRGRGLRVTVFPLRRERSARMHPEAAAVVEQACFRGLLDRRTWAANLRSLVQRPLAYLGALFSVVRANLGSPRYLAGGLAAFPKAVAFAEEMSARGVTHVHAHFASHPAAAAFVIQRLTGIPYSFTAHGSDLHRDRHMLCEKVAEASFVVAISRYNQEVIAEECGDAALRTTLVLHCGVDTQRFRPRSAMAPAARPVPRLLCVGSLHEVKGQQHLIEACRLLRARGLELAVQLVGEGPDRAALARQINEAGLGDRIELTGTRTSVELAELLRGADLVATPSVPSRDGRREGIPVALMEAMATGLPVVASRLSGIPELVEHDKSGLLVEPGDVDGLADAIELLCSEPALRKRLGRAAREKVLSEFDLNANAAALAELFTSRSVS